MRSVPADLVLQPMPADFALHVIEDRGDHLKWTGTIGARRYELGVQTDTVEARDLLRQGVWQLHELHRLNRPDLMAYARADRHKGRSPLAPQFTPEAQAS